jgi:hypothetical protein
MFMYMKKENVPRCPDSVTFTEVLLLKMHQLSYTWASTQGKLPSVFFNSVRLG